MKDEVKKLDINLDFDGTCVSHEFPKTGKDIGAVPVLKKLIANGHRLILFTMRSDRTESSYSNDPNILLVSGNHLANALKWFMDNGIELYGIQSNPTQLSWTSSPKSYAPLMIDDSALGCPLKFDAEVSNRPYVDWEKVESMLVERGMIIE